MQPTFNLEEEKDVGSGILGILLCNTTNNIEIKDLVTPMELEAMLISIVKMSFSNTIIAKILMVVLLKFWEIVRTPHLDTM